MTVTGFLLLVLIGAACGAGAGVVVGRRRGGLFVAAPLGLFRGPRRGRGGFLVAALIGLAGALVGNWGAPQIHLPSYLTVQVGGHTIEILWAILGAVALLLVLNFFGRGSDGRWRHAR